MDAVDWKAVVSGVSAVVAVASAFLAHRAKIQTRTDIFDSQRDALILAMAENDNRCSHLTLQFAFAREELERVLPFIKSNTEVERAKAFLGNLAAIDQVTTSTSGREYNASNLDELKYSEEALVSVRRMARGEQVIAKGLAAETYDLIIEHVQRFISKHNEGT